MTLQAVHGKRTDILLGALDIREWFESLDIDTTVTSGDATTFGHNWKVNIVGLATGKVAAGGFYDPAFTAIKSSLMAAADEIVTTGMDGFALGAMVDLIAGITVNYKESAKLGSVVAFAWSLDADDILSQSFVTHALAAEAAPGDTGDADAGSSSTDGMVAHIHLTALTGGDSVTFDLDDSPDGASWTTRATVTLSGVGGARLSKRGTVARHTRIAWSGEADPITFLTALGRGKV